MSELLWMSEGRGRFEWGLTSSLMALIANTNRDPRRHGPYRPRDFDPYGGEEHRKPTMKTKDLSILKRVFVDQERSAS